MSIGVGIIGYGYWGPNLARNFQAAQDAELIGVADQNQASLDRAKAAHLGIQTFQEARDLIDCEQVDAVVIATPVASHYSLACQAIEKGKHVLIEKPICRTVAETEDLIARAEQAGCVLMVDHTFLFTGAVEEIRRIITAGELGDVCYVDSTRVNLGLFQPDVNCLWDLAPHDLSIIDNLFPSDVISIEATGYGHIDETRPDMVFMTLHFADNRVAHFNMSWMSPVKIRRFAIGGTKKMLIWDDLDQDQKIKVFDSGISFQPEDQRSRIIPDYRTGDIFSPRLPRTEALAGVAGHFVDVIKGRTESIMNGTHGLRVVTILEEAQRQLDLSLARVSRARAGSGQS